MKNLSVYSDDQYFIHGYVNVKIEKILLSSLGLSQKS